MLKHIFSETIRPIELKFHMKSPYDRLANICTNCSGHIAKMATKPIHVKPFKYLPGTKRQMTLGLGM